MVKRRNGRGRVVGTKLRVVFGNPDEVLAKLDGLHRADPPDNAAHEWPLSA